MIQRGFRSQATGTNPSCEFVISLENKVIAGSLIRCSGKVMDLHYKEYIGVLTRHGVSKYMVDCIISINKMQ